MSCIKRLIASKAVYLNSSESAYVEGGGEFKGYEYLIILVRGMGHRCGYVAIDETHPLYSLSSWHDEKVESIKMHGGCTFYEKQKTDFDCNDMWIGFDCAHAGDAPDLKALKDMYIKTNDTERLNYKMPSAFFTDDEVRSFDFVVRECKDIIKQIERWV